MKNTTISRILAIAVASAMLLTGCGGSVPKEYEESQERIHYVE